MQSKEGPATLYCGGCRKSFPARELKLDRKTDSLKCEGCRK